MKDSHGSIIYVGKSKNLKNRVQSYFQNSKSHTQKVQKLVKNLKDFDYILTDTEFEAFMLECKLIKELKPAYNKKMKSPRSYTYIVIQMDNAYQRIGMTNSPIDNDNNIYFGPYTSKNTVERALQGIKEFFKINCVNPSKKNNICLNYALGLCMGICQGGSALELYNKIIHKIIALLNGTDMDILAEMKHKMLNASANFEFETAAKYRDYIEAISFLLNREAVIEFTEENHNIVMIEYLSDSTIKLFLIKGNKVLFSETYILEQTNIEKLCSIIKTNILTYFKNNPLHSSIKISRDEIDEAQIIYSYMKGSSTNNRIIPEQWLDSEKNSNVDEVIINLLCRSKV